VVTDAAGLCSAVVTPGGFVQATVQDPSGVYASGFYTTTSSTGYTSDPGDGIRVPIADAGLDLSMALPGLRHITGRVTTSSGAPLSSGVLVCACYQHDLCPHGVRASIRPDGTYSIDVGPGTWTLMVGSSWDKAIGYYSSSGFTTSLAAATRIVIDATDATGIDVVIPG
jgi:hypothetical protein